jgi:hypothetical protein
MREYKQKVEKTVREILHEKQCSTIIVFAFCAIGKRMIVASLCWAWAMIHERTRLAARKKGRALAIILEQRNVIAPPLRIHPPRGKVDTRIAAALVRFYFLVIATALGDFCSHKRPSLRRHRRRHILGARVRSQQRAAFRLVTSTRVQLGLDTGRQHALEAAFDMQCDQLALRIHTLQKAARGALHAAHLGADADAHDLLAKHDQAAAVVVQKALDLGQVATQHFGGALAAAAAEPDRPAFEQQEAEHGQSRLALLASACQLRVLSLHQSRGDRVHQRVAPRVHAALESEPHQPPTLGVNLAGRRVRVGGCGYGCGCGQGKRVPVMVK